MSPIHNGNTKRPKPKQNQLGIFGISTREFKHFAENPAEGFESRRAYCWGHIPTRIHPKSFHIFFLKVAATLLSGSRKSTVGA